MSARTAPLWCYSAKKTSFFPASLAPLMCHGQARLLFALIFPHSLPLPPLSKVSSLYWMVQKQNHKPISVILAMRLDRPNLSPFGAIGSTPVSLKRPLSSRQRGSFLFGDNCNWALEVHVTHSKSSAAFRDMMACCAHYRRAMSRMALFVTNNQTVHRVPLHKASRWFQMIPNDLFGS